MHDQKIKERIQRAIERSRQVFLPAVRALIESEPLRFQGVTAEGLVTVMLGIAEGCALQSSFNNKPVDVEQILTALRALLVGKSQ